MAKQTREQLGVKAGDEIILKGNIAFSRLDKLVEGEALVKENERRRKIGAIAAEKPFRLVVIEDIEVVKGKNSPLATYYGSDVFADKKTGKQRLSIESKSPKAPVFGHMQDGGSVLQIADPEKNPNTGQEVYLHIKAFASKGYSNLGSTFNAVVYGPGEISFYNGGDTLDGFGELMGIEVSKKSQEVQENEVESAFDNIQNAFGVQDSDVEDTSETVNPFNADTKENPFA